MKNIKIKSALLSVVALSGVYIAQSANSFTIDNFDNASQALSDNSGSPGGSIDTGTDASIIGGARDLQVFVNNTGSGFVSSTVITGDNVTDPLGNPLGWWVVSKTVGTRSISSSIVWDGTTPAASNPLAVTTNGLGSRDFTGNPLNPNVAIKFDIVSFNDVAVGSSASLTLWSDNGLNTAVSIIADISTLSLGSDLFFNYSTFSGINFATISAIRFDVNLLPQTGQSSNFGIDFVELVPVPFEFNPAIGVGILGLAWGANKLRKAKKASSN